MLYIYKLPPHFITHPSIFSFLHICDNVLQTVVWFHELEEKKNVTVFQSCLACLVLDDSDQRDKLFVWCHDITKICSLVLNVPILSFSFFLFQNFIPLRNSFLILKGGGILEIEGLSSSTTEANTKLPSEWPQMNTRTNCPALPTTCIPTFPFLISTSSWKEVLFWSTPWCQY